MIFKAPETYKDWGILLSAWLSILALGLKAIFNVDISPFVGDIVDFLLLTVFILVSLWGVWKNTYVSNGAKLQKKALVAQKLIKK
jgi:hypothetical protein